MSGKLTLFCILFFLTAYLHLHAQEHKSIHQLQSEFYSQYKHGSESEYDKLNPYRGPGVKNYPYLSHQVFGWNPYWAGTAYTSYNYSLLSTVAYFSYEVDTATGSYSTIHSWKTTNLVQLAHNSNDKVVLTVTNFGSDNNVKILGNQQKSQRLIDSIVALVQFRVADGVNIDFETVPVSQRQNLVSFMTNLSTRIHTAIPGSQVSIDLPAVDWTSTFDVQSLNSVCDYLIIMGYEYYWNGSQYAGPNSPLTSGNLWGTYNLTYSVSYYLAHGASPSKLLLGLPYFGHEWPTVSNAIHSQTTGTGTSYTYATMKPRVLSYGRIWDVNSQTPWYTYQTTGWQQGWYDDSVSLGLKYDFVINQNLAGIAIWALSYDGSNMELWNEIAAKFNISGITGTGETATEFRLYQNYPNPFNPTTKIKFSLPFPSKGGVMLVIYDMLGREVATLIPPLWGGQEGLASGFYEVEWNASNYPSGIYFYRLTAGGYTLTKKMILLK